MDRKTEEIIGPGPERKNVALEGAQASLSIAGAGLAERLRAAREGQAVPDRRPPLGETVPAAIQVLHTLNPEQLPNKE